MYKKLLILFTIFSMLIVGMPAVKASGEATVFRPSDGHRKVVTIGDPSAFDGGYLLEVAQVVNIPEDVLGFSVVTDFSKSLSSSMSSSQTTIPVTSMTTKDDVTLTMGILGAKVFLVIEPGRRKEEIVMCTGISGTSFTGCTRGLAFYGTSTASVSANRETHNSGSQVIISNTHYVYDELVDKDSAETIAGIKTFSSIPVLPATNPTDDNQAARKGYIDSVAIAGGATSTETVSGIGQIATQAEQASNTFVAANPTFLSTKYASSTPASRYTVISNTDSLIDPTWYQSNDHTFSGANTFTGSAIDKNSNEILGNVQTMTASSTIAGATLPVAVYLATSTSAVNAVDGNDTGTMEFIGFAITSAVDGGSIDVQTTGIVAGFTGLTVGKNYYSQNDKTIGVTPPGSAIMVGTAVSATELKIQQVGDQYMGSIGLSNNGVNYVPDSVNKLVILYEVDSGDTALEGNITLYRVGLVNQEVRIEEDNGVGPQEARVRFVWTGNEITTTNGDLVGNATLHMYR